MGYSFSKADGNDRYFGVRAFNSSQLNQWLLAPKALHYLRSVSTTTAPELEFDFFFYTDTAEKAEQLAAALRQLHYTVHTGPVPGKSNLFSITGCTPPLRSDDEIVAQWTTRMCELGYEFDCEFDGWGTGIVL